MRDPLLVSLTVQLEFGQSALISHRCVPLIVGKEHSGVVDCWFDMTFECSHRSTCGHKGEMSFPDVRKRFFVLFSSSLNSSHCLLLRSKSQEDWKPRLVYDSDGLIFEGDLLTEIRSLTFPDLLSESVIQP